LLLLLLLFVGCVDLRLCVCFCACLCLIVFRCRFLCRFFSCGMLLVVMCLFGGAFMCGVWCVVYGMLVLGDAAAARWDGAGVGAWA